MKKTADDTLSHAVQPEIGANLALSLPMRCLDIRLRPISLPCHTASPQSWPKLIRAVDLFLPSRQNVLAIFPGAGPLEALRKLRALASDVALIAIKCGADGVIAHVAGTHECIHVPAMPVELVDTTGAGDAFCGGVLAGFAEGEDPINALLYGTVSAAFCIEHLGFSGLSGATEEKVTTRVAAHRGRVAFRPM
jgi:sugar/nucleoside kinase (ribokinase family)